MSSSDPITAHLISWLNPPSITFALIWLVCSNTYALLDASPPDWYHKRSCTPKIPILTFDTWFRIFKNNLRNLVFSYAVMVFMAFGRFEVFGLDSWVPMLLKPIFNSNALDARNNTMTDNDGKDINNHTNGMEQWVIGLVIGLVEFIGCYIWGELWFWFSHWGVHQSEWWMNHVHRQHHEFNTYTYAIVGFYASIPEMLVINLPLALGFAILAKINPVSFAIWLGILAWHISNNHSCHWVLPKWFDDPSYHLIHHSQWNLNYGASWVERLVLGQSKKSNNSRKTHTTQATYPNQTTNID